MANQVLYGFLQLKDLFTERVNDVGVDVVSTAIDRTVAEHNRQINALIDLFADRTTKFKFRYKVPTVQRLQPLDENGRARPVKALGYYDTALPLMMAGSAWGANFVTMEKMTVGDANKITQSMLMADARWNRDHILSALLTNVSWVYTDPEHGDLTVLPLANADTQEYLIQTGADAGATDTHFLAQAAAIADGADPFPAIVTELQEHPENAGQLIAFIPTNLKSAVEGLTAFIDETDPNIRVGANVTELIGNLDVAVPGEVIGYHTAGIWIVHWQNMVSSYIVAVAVGGDRPLAMREEDVASLRGFNRVANRDDHPFYERQWLRIAGYGAQNRVGAVVIRIGNGSYAVPTGYLAPQP